MDFSRRRFLRTLLLSAGGSLLGAAASSPPVPPPAAAAGQVRDEFLHAWNGYKRFAWGHDEVLPITGKPSDFFIDGHSFGLSIIEALDTLYVMGLDEELRACVEWLRSNLTFDVDGEVEMFEAMIRMVAGLIAGYYATGESFMLKGARDLVDRLLPCFTKSPSGAPYRFVNLRTGTVRDPVSNLAEIGSNVLELGDLSRLTGDSKYFDAAMKAFETVIAKRSTLDLLGTTFDVEHGAFVGTDDVAPNPPADSFYEYLWGGWQMLGIARCRDWYRMVTDAILKYQLTHVNGNPWFQTVDYLTGAPTSDKTQSILAAFYAEILAKGGDRAIGEGYYDTWTLVAQKYGLFPEAMNFTDLSVVSPSYTLRPEYANSTFDLWFLTHSDKYRRTGYAHFDALRRNCRVVDGYAAIADVTTTPMTFNDYFPAYSFSENFKYLYLIFADSPRFDGAKYYLNTEGKVLRGLRPTR